MSRVRSLFMMSQESIRHPYIATEMDKFQEEKASREEDKQSFFTTVNPDGGRIWLG